MMRPRCEVLDPCLLGRPVHLLHQFATQWREDMNQALELGAHRRYWGALQVEAIRFLRQDSSALDTRWLPQGETAFAIERQLLLALLNQRYGADAPIDTDSPVTATEERLAEALGSQLAEMLARRIDANAPATAPRKARAPATPGPGAWEACIVLSDPYGALRGQCRMALGKDLMMALLRGLAPQRMQAVRPQPVPLATRLQVRLDARLASKDLALGQLFDLRPGDVVPISLDRAAVLLDESCLFTAAVTEHKGKLCLTAFEDA
jgi:flagellar motor switch protein FliM